jgi:hypothetical protein
MSLSKTVVDTKDMATIVGQVDLAPGGEHRDRLRKGKIEPVAVGSCRSHHLQYDRNVDNMKDPLSSIFYWLLPSLRPTMRNQLAARDAHTELQLLHAITVWLPAKSDMADGQIRYLTRYVSTTNHPLQLHTAGYIPFLCPNGPR